MTRTTKKWLRTGLFAAGGVLVGLIYHYTSGGCVTGCPITSSPWITMAYTGLIGLLLANVFRKKEEN